MGERELKILITVLTVIGVSIYTILTNQSETIPKSCENIDKIEASLKQSIDDLRFNENDEYPPIVDIRKYNQLKADWYELKHNCR